MHIWQCKRRKKISFAVRLCVCVHDVIEHTQLFIKEQTRHIGIEIYDEHFFMLSLDYTH